MPGVVPPQRCRAKRTARATAGRAGRIVRVVGVREHTAWSRVYSRARMEEWARRMKRAERNLPETKIFWAPPRALSAFAEYQPPVGIPIHAVTVHAHSAQRSGGKTVCLGRRDYAVADVVRAVARWKPRKIVLIICDSADGWQHLPDVNVPVWAARGTLWYTREHELWEGAGCTTRKRTAYTKLVDAGFSRVQ